MKNRFGVDWSGMPGTQFWRRPQIERRLFFRHAASALAGYFLMPQRPFERVARAAVSPKATAKNCIFILMDGGPSHVDTFDFKEGSWTPANFKPEQYGGIRFPQGLMPALASQMESMSFVRSCRAWAAVHGLARTWVQIGRNPASSTAKIAPHIGSVVSIELGGKTPGAVLPAFVALNTGFGVGQGYLAPEHGPFYISPGGNGIGNTRHGDGPARFDRRYGLLLQMDGELRRTNDLGPGGAETLAFLDGARKLVYNSEVDALFTFDQAEKNRFGNTGFGNACIAARNLLKANSGVRFIQITQGNWDQHENIYATNAGHNLLANQFDKGLGTLIADLRNEGLLDDTLIVALGEFGRVPGPLNSLKGRDHFLVNSVLFAGGRIRGGRAIGATDGEGRNITEPGWARGREIRPEDIEATIYSALGIDWTTVRKDDPLNRGFEYVPFSDRDLYGPVDALWE